MPKFQKRPVVIEAIQLQKGMTREEVCAFYPDADLRYDPKTGESGVNIATLEGVMGARIGDWIIKGIAGEYYPCKDHIFQATYVAVDDNVSDT